MPYAPPCDPLSPTWALFTIIMYASIWHARDYINHRITTDNNEKILAKADRV